MVTLTLPKVLKRTIRPVFNFFLVFSLLIPYGFVPKDVFAVVDSITPSTNDINRSKGWAHVDVDEGVGEATFEFISTRNFYSCFEYRTDGDTSQITTPNNPNKDIADGYYPYFCQINNSRVKTIKANQYIEIRMVFGAERDERFDWTRFDVKVAPTVPVLESPIDGVYTNDNTPLMQWKDSTDSDGSVSGYYYRVYRNCTSDIIPTSCSVWPSNTGLWLTTSQYQAGTTQDGTYHWQVQAKDNEGNTSEWSELEKVIIDTTAPSRPTGLHRVGLDNAIYECGDRAKLQTLIPDWNDNPEIDIAYYEYTSFHPNESIGLNENKVYTSKFVHSWIPTLEGSYGFAVRAVDKAGNKSGWALESKTLTGSCIITYDSTPPQAPSIIFPTQEQYFNTTPILNQWTPVSDDSGIKNYRIEYVYDDHHTFSNMPYRETVTTRRNHTPAVHEQGGVTIRVQAIDNVGNESPWSESVHYYFDSINPEIPTLISPTNNSFVNGKTLTNSWSEIIDADYYEYESYHDEELNDLRWYQEVNGTSKTAYNVAESTFWWRVRAVDLAGNKSDWSEAWKVTVDNEKPQFTEVSDSELNEGDQLTSVLTTPSDNNYVDSICYSITTDTNLGDVAENCLSITEDDVDLHSLLIIAYSLTGLTTVDTSQLPEGTYTISFYVTDKAGNESLTKEYQLTINNVLPNVIFTSDEDLVAKNENVEFYGFFTDPGLDDSEWTYKLDFGDLTPTVTGTAVTPGIIILNLNHKYSIANTYTASLEVCESNVGQGDGNCVTKEIDIVVENGLARAAEAVQGTSTNRNRNSSATNNAVEVLTELLGTGGPEDELLTETLDTEEVKGINDCEVKKKISGYLYIDSNTNGVKDENEKVLKDIKVRIFNETNGTQTTIAEIKTDENGYWETYACEGEYFVEVDLESLPNNTSLDSNTKVITISNNTNDVTVDFGIQDTRNFLQKNWPWMLLGLSLLGVISFVVLDTRKQRA